MYYGIWFYGYFHCWTAGSWYVFEDVKCAWDSLHFPQIQAMDSELPTWGISKFSISTNFFQRTIHQMSPYTPLHNVTKCTKNVPNVSKCTKNQWLLSTIWVTTNINGSSIWSELLPVKSKLFLISPVRLCLLRIHQNGMRILFWLVVSTHLKNISQNGSFPQVGVKIKNVWNHHPVLNKPTITG